MRHGASSSHRICITGCCGSGKTHLARRLSEKCGITPTTMDSIVYRRVPVQDRTDARTRPERREDEEIRELFDEALQAREWIIEGVYGELIRRALPSATEFIWLDIPKDVCLKGMKQREEQLRLKFGRLPGAAIRDRLEHFIQKYPTRDDSIGRKFHESLFNQFGGRCWHLTNWQEVDDWFSTFPQKQFS